MGIYTFLSQTTCNNMDIYLKAGHKSVSSLLPLCPQYMLN